MWKGRSIYVKKKCRPRRLVCAPRYADSSSEFWFSLQDTSLPQSITQATEPQRNICNRRFFYGYVSGELAGSVLNYRYRFQLYCPLFSAFMVKVVAYGGLRCSKLLSRSHLWKTVLLDQFPCHKDRKAGKTYRTTRSHGGLKPITESITLL